MTYFIAIGDTFTPRLFWDGTEFQPDAAKARSYPTYRGCVQACRRKSKVEKTWYDQIEPEGHRTLWTLSEANMKSKGLIQ